MSFRGQLFIVAATIIMAIFLLYALRRRKINEEYCLWWLFSLVAVDVLVLNQRLLTHITHMIGALVPVSTLTLFSLILIIGMLMYFSMKISVLSNKLNEVVQSMAVERSEYEQKLSKLSQELHEQR